MDTLHYHTKDARHSIINTVRFCVALVCSTFFDVPHYLCGLYLLNSPQALVHFRMFSFIIPLSNTLSIITFALPNSFHNLIPNILCKCHMKLLAYKKYSIINLICCIFTSTLSTFVHSRIALIHTNSIIYNLYSKGKEITFASKVCCWAKSDECLHIPRLYIDLKPTDMN